MSIEAPATNPASNLALKLPATIGSANQILKNSGTAGTSLITVRSNATLGVNDHLYLDEGVLFPDGAYITYTETQCNSVTAFYG